MTSGKDATGTVKLRTLDPAAGPGEEQAGETGAADGEEPAAPRAEDQETIAEPLPGDDGEQVEGRSGGGAPGKDASAAAPDADGEPSAATADDGTALDAASGATTLDNGSAPEGDVALLGAAEGDADGSEVAGRGEGGSGAAGGLLSASEGEPSAVARKGDAAGDASGAADAADADGVATGEDTLVTVGDAEGIADDGDEHGDEHGDDAATGDRGAEAEHGDGDADPDTKQQVASGEQARVSAKGTAGDTDARAGADTTTETDLDAVAPGDMETEAEGISVAAVTDGGDAQESGSSAAPSDDATAEAAAALDNDPAATSSDEAEGTGGAEENGGNSPAKDPRLVVARGAEESPRATTKSPRSVSPRSVPEALDKDPGDAAEETPGQADGAADDPAADKGSAPPRTQLSFPSLAKAAGPATGTPGTARSGFADTAGDAPPSLAKTGTSAGTSTAPESRPGVGASETDGKPAKAGPTAEEPAPTATALPSLSKAPAAAAATATPAAVPSTTPAASSAAPAKVAEPAQDSPERTQQQPAPPEPTDPLKLLADLTNTPPPPETPLRTFARRIKIWTPLAILLIIVAGVAQMLRPLPTPALSLSAPATHAFKGKAPTMPWPSEGQSAIKVQGLGSFGSEGGDKPRAIASVTKVMTAYVILQEHPLKKGAQGPQLTVDQKAQDHYEKGLPENESVIKVIAGDEISEYEALRHLLIPSANNIAMLLARWDAGSEKTFTVKMNKAAKKLGMTRTTYTDPSGLDATTVSTARDQVKLAEAAMKDPVFREIVNTGVYRPEHYDTDVYNHNRLLHRDGVIGLKTGNSTAAGANLLFAAEKEIGGTKQLIVGAVLGQRGAEPGQTAANASQALIVAARNTLTSTTLIKKGEIVGHVDDGLGTRTPVLATKDVVAVGWSGLTVRLEMEAEGGGVPSKAGKGETVGTLTVGDGPGQVRVPVKLKAATEEPSFVARLLRIL